MYDIVIKGGAVVDGTGAPRFDADVAISQQKIAAIGGNLRGARVLDASGCVVAPGFIDIHTHYDAQVFFDPALTPSSFHGVTSVVAGNCGFSIAPTRAGQQDLIARTLEKVEDMNVDVLKSAVPWAEFQTFSEYLAAVRGRGVTLNYGALVGHSALRLFVMGAAAYSRAATEEEVARMQDELRDAMNAGAAGFSTSFMVMHLGADGLPVPSRFSDRAEFHALLAVMAEMGRGVVEIADGDQCTFEELYELQPSVGVPFIAGGILAVRDGDHRRQLVTHAAGVRAGADVWPQVTQSSLALMISMLSPGPFNANPLFAELIGLPFEERRRAYSDPQWREKAAVGFPEGKYTVPAWETYQIVKSDARPERVSRFIVEIAQERGVTPFEALLDAALEEPNLDLRVRIAIANSDREEVSRLLTQEHCLIGLSDAGAHVTQICDAPQTTDFLGNWVRDQGLMPLEEGVRRLTGAQADLFGFAGRGYVRAGHFADLVVFDPQTIAPGPIVRQFDFPGSSERLSAPNPVGVRHVLVNGSPIRVDENSLPASEHGNPGRILHPEPRGRTRAVPQQPAAQRGT